MNFVSVAIEFIDNAKVVNEQGKDVVTADLK